MATFSSVTRQHVLQALAEYDERGGDTFLRAHGFTPSAGTLTHEGREYDWKAVLGVAHRFATGRLATSEEVDSGSDVGAAILRKRGFDLSLPSSRPASTTAARVTRPRAATRVASTRSTATREAAVAICPTCSMTLPATGICDDCG